jgi:O-antigen biosynthesis protein
MKRVDQLRWVTGLVRDDPRGMAREAALRASSVLTPEGRAEHAAQAEAASTDRYRMWIAATEPDTTELHRQMQLQAQLARRPLISFLTPVLSPPVPVLVDLLESVLAQTYDNFELCIGHFASDPATRQILERYAAVDPRIRFHVFEENEGISVNSTRCFELSTGEYLALVDHDDTIAPNALYEYVVRLNEAPFELAYSDRDKLGADGQRHEPFFKTGWAPESLFSTNYLTHLTVFSRRAFVDAGGWEPTTDGAQDWDLFLRIVERAERVVHIPKVLYHWRVSPGSTAMAMSAKPYSWAAQRLTVQRRLERMHVDASVVSRHDGSLRLDFGLPSRSDVQVVLLVRGPRHVRGALRHLRRRLPRDVPIHVHDRSSGVAGHGLSALFDELGGEQNVVVVGDGIRLRRNQSLASLTGWLTVPGVVAAGGKVVARAGGIADIGRVLHLGEVWGAVYRGRRTRRSGPYGSTYWYTNVYAPALNLFAFRLERARELLEGNPIGLRATFLDLFVLINESGQRCVYTPDVVAIDIAAGTSPHPLVREHHLPVPDHDPYFNPNLSRQHLIPTIAAAVPEGPP